RLLTLLTVPDTQTCDMIADAAQAAPAAAWFADALSSRGDWDELRLDYLHPDGLVARSMLPALRGAGLFCSLHDSGRNLYIPLHGSWESYWATRTRSLKKASSLATNRLNKA